MEKLLAGLLLLFALLFLIFRNMTRQNRTLRNNNPFALIHSKARYEGQTGRDADGFLKFQSPAFGVRAGFINLFQTYINAGFDSIDKIFDSNRVYPVYGDAGKGEQYKAMVEEFTGIPRLQKLSLPEVFEVGRAIERVEAGKNWVDDESAKLGWQMAITKLGL